MMGEGVVGSVDPRAALHRINGELLEALRDVLPDVRWNEWIVNVIILHRLVEATETVSLETSATYYKGNLVCDRNQLGGDVHTLDGPVPLDESYAGYCIRTGNYVWVENLIGLQSGQRDSPLKNVYRSFKYVGVETTHLPNAEYVFPIRLRVGSNEIILGVLNCEWYAPENEPYDNQFSERDVVVHRIITLLERHARFLPLLLHIDASQDHAAKWMRLLDYYRGEKKRWTMEILGRRDYENSEYSSATALRQEIEIA
jgi:hypothetical protein